MNFHEKWESISVSESNYVLSATAGQTCTQDNHVLLMTAQYLE